MSTAPPPMPPPGAQIGEAGTGAAVRAKKPIWKRWWVWAVAVIMIIGVGSAASGGNSSPSSASAPTPTDTSSAAPSSAATSSPTASIAAASNPLADAKSALNDTYGTFAPVVKAGASDTVIKLPAGIKAGIATMTYKGSSNFIVEVLDSSNQSTGDSLANEIGSWHGTSAFGLSSLGNAAAKIQVQGQGSWTITISPVSSAPEITFPAVKKGTGVFIYTGSADTWAFTHNGSANFIVSTYGTDGSTNGGLVNEIGHYSGTVPAQAGPALITVLADGTWTIKAG